MENKKPTAEQRNEMPENMLKHFNYAEQMNRLKKAMKYEFYLEATFIEYAVIEDRIESFLIHAGAFNPEKHNMLTKKLRKLESLAQEKNSLIRRYVSAELINSVHEWKNRRNLLTHAMMKNNLTKEQLRTLSEDGMAIVKQLSNKSTSYKRYLERNNKEK